MDLKKVLAIVGVVVVLGAIVAGISFLLPLMHAPSPAQTVSQNQQVPSQKVVIGRSFIGGMYTFNGNVVLSDTCVGLSTHMQTVAGNPIHLGVELTTSKSQQPCPEGATTTTPFSFAISVPPQASSTPIIDSVTVDGTNMQFTVATSSLQKK